MDASIIGPKDSSDKSVEAIHSLATFLFGENYSLMFDKYIFGFKKVASNVNGNVYGENGDIIFDEDVVDVIPLVNAGDNDKVGYALLTKESRDSLNNWKDRSVTDARIASLFESMMDTKCNIAKASYVDILLRDGSIDKAIIVSVMTIDLHGKIYFKLANRDFFFCPKQDEQN